MGHAWSEFINPETTPLRDMPSQFEPHYGFATERREKSNILQLYFVTKLFCYVLTNVCIKYFL